ncbi:MAG TPA: glycosyltransferase family 2 protein [Chloroflexota bacterium]|nr:glycosyltransferase family 2 protein [Chloroflexota bacterium]
MSSRVTVSIPNWNGARYLRACLDSLRAQSFQDFDVAVVDNGSTDDSLQILAEDYPQVRIVGWETNRGVAAAFNEGVRQCRGELLALLNNDMEVAPDWLAALVQALERDPKAGAAASKILFIDRRTINSAGDVYRRDGIPGNRGVHEIDQGQYDRTEYVFGASGGASLFRRQLFDEIGFFDERLVSYCEDVDWAWRLQLAGYRCLYVPEAVAYHWGSATGGGELASYYSGRNFIRVLFKNLPGAVMRRHWRAILGRELSLALEALRHGREPAARARLAGQLAGLRSVPEALRQRKWTMSMKRVSDDYIESLLV